MMMSKLKTPIFVLLMILICFQIFQFAYRNHVFKSVEIYEKDNQIGYEKEDTPNAMKGDLVNMVQKVMKENMLSKKESFGQEETSSSTSTSTSTSTTTTTTTSPTIVKKSDGSLKLEKKTEVELSASVTNAAQAKIAEDISLWKYAPKREKSRNGSTSVYDGRNLLQDPVFKFDQNFKNPCWFEEQALNCLPYVYVIGVKKCGTSDLFYRLSLHPDFIKPGFKEAQWFARKRFRPGGTFDDIDEYIAMFSAAASKILYQSTSIRNGTLHNYVHVTGEGSPSNLHLNSHWKNLPGNENLDEPKYVILDYIRHFIPQAKLIITFRDPVERLYSDYYHEYGSLIKTNKPNPRQFHKIASEGVKLYQDCFRRHSVRNCVYEPSLYAQTRIQIQLGIYYIFWQELTRVFPRDQILVLQNKNLRDKENTMKTVYKFLDLRSLAPVEMRRIITAEDRYQRSKRNSKKGPMLNETYDLLHDFYKPFNQRSLTEDEMEEVVNKREAYTRRESFKQEGPMLIETLHILQNFYRPFNKLMAKLTNDNNFLYEYADSAS